MTRPWRILAVADRPEGRLELRQRGESELVICIGGRVLMNSAAHRSEQALAAAACGPVGGRDAPRVLVGGLGMGFTLRAALDALPRTAEVVVAEIDPLIVEWCRGPLAGLTRNAVADPRVRIDIADVAVVIAREAAAAPAATARFDAILLDLYEGPRGATQGRDDPLYGRTALTATRAALRPGGRFAVWSEEPDAAFEARLRAAGFAWRRERPAGGGPRHAVYLAEPPAAAAGPAAAAAPPGATRPVAPRQRRREDRYRPRGRRRAPGSP